MKQKKILKLICGHLNTIMAEVTKESDQRASQKYQLNELDNWRRTWEVRWDNFKTAALVIAWIVGGTLSLIGAITIARGVL